MFISRESPDLSDEQSIEPSAETQPGRSQRALELPRWKSLSVAVVWVTIVGLVIVGIALRVFYIEQRPITSDEAVAGLMAAQMLHGHFVAFYWGQSYGGSLEPVMIAAAFKLFGQTQFYSARSRRSWPRWPLS